MFIIATEVLSALNKLMTRKEFKKFKMTKKSPMINHVVFADDIIILYKVEVRTMQLIATTLEKYEKV